MNPHIPVEVAAKERVHVTSRRRKFGVADDAPPLGIALSGGGIRSATVSLGVFQYLAHEERRVRDEIAAAQVTQKAPADAAEQAAAAAAKVPPRPRLLSRIDYCSSVSGGGYFATFFGSLFLPKDERAKGAQVTPEVFPAAVEGAPPPKSKWELAAERAADMLCDTIFDGSRMTPMRWLRENGRYLAPTGGGDYLYAAAVAGRNFVGLHYVIGVSLVAIFLLAAVIRVLGFAYFPEFWVGTVEAYFMPEAGGNFWPSVWWVPAIATFALLVVPISVGFFLAQTEFKGKRIRLNLPLITAIGIAVLCFTYAFAGQAPELDWLLIWLQRNAVPEVSPSSPSDWGPARLATAYIGLVASLAIVIYLVTKHSARQLAGGGAQPAQAKPGERAVEPAATTITQTMLSHSVMVPLMVTLALAAYALVDTIGQTVYALWTVGAEGKWLAGGGTIALLIPLLKKLLPLVTGSGDPATKSWVRIPMSSLAFIAGVALFVAVASLWSALTHGLIWRGDRPAGDPGCVMIMPGEDNPQQDVALDSARRIVVATPLRDVECVRGAGPLEPAEWAWLFGPLLAISILTGRRVGFINLSSLQRYYAGHLMRSYLRASLFAEDPEVERDVRNPAREDDITVDTYYNPSLACAAPPHQRDDEPDGGERLATRPARPEGNERRHWPHGFFDRQPQLRGVGPGSDGLQPAAIPGEGGRRTRRVRAAPLRGWDEARRRAALDRQLVRDLRRGVHHRTWQGNHTRPVAAACAH